MKGIKIYLGVVTVMLIVALLLGVYVWYTLLTLPSPAEEAPVLPDIQSSENENEGEERESQVEVREDIKIKKEDLTDSQKKALEAFGINVDSIVITEEMIVCAKAGLGEDRFALILDGSAPGPLEAVKLYGCFKQND